MKHRTLLITALLTGLIVLLGIVGFYASKKTDHSPGSKVTPITGNTQALPAPNVRNEATPPRIDKAQSNIACDKRIADIFLAMNRANSVKEYSGELLRSSRLGSSLIVDCPESEEAQYLYLRLTEIGVLKMPPGQGTASLEADLEKALKQYPNSTRIKTVIARITKDIELARSAFETSPQYLPIRVAYASLLLRTKNPNNIKVARDLLENQERLDQVSGGIPTLAQAYQYLGMNRQAIETCKRDEVASGRLLEIVSPTYQLSTRALCHTILAGQSRAP